MPHIELGTETPGIRGLLQYRPETAGPLSGLTDFLMRGDNTLTRGERELIAAYVSRLNECEYCTGSHSACAAAQLPGGAELVRQVLAGPENAEISDKLRALLRIAGRVQQGGRQVSEQDVAAARAEGATDLEIHDAVLIAAVFCMLNRYVDGLATKPPQDPAEYVTGAARLIADGYRPPPAVRRDRCS